MGHLIELDLKLGKTPTEEELDVRSSLWREQGSVEMCGKCALKEVRPELGWGL